MTDKWPVELQEDPDTKELVLPIPIDILSQMGWSENTELWWEIDGGNLIVKEQNESETSTPK